MNNFLFKALGVASFDERIFMCYRATDSTEINFRIDYSTDADNFSKFSSDAFINDTETKLKISNVSDFRLTKNENLYYLLFLTRNQSHAYLSIAKSKDIINWETIGRMYPLTEPALLLPKIIYKKQNVIFFGGDELKVAFSEDMSNWNVHPLALAKPNEVNQEKQVLYIVGNAKETINGPLITYFVKETHHDHVHYYLNSLMVSEDNPTKILWQTENPIWNQPQEWIGKPIRPVGVVELEDIYYSYWEWSGKGIFCVEHKAVKEIADTKSQLPHASLVRIANNPIVAPHPEHLWESKQVFNPAAVYHEGKVHLLYRAIGEHDTSVLGYIQSDDGLTMDHNVREPAYIPREAFEHPQPGKPIKLSPYESGGGGYGGIEDPRITKIGRRFYLTYVAYDGRNPPRVALSSISSDSFNKRRWDMWNKPVLISPPGVVDKNACVLPEKINGKYVIFHRIYPDILIDYVDNLDFDGNSGWLKGEFKIHPRRDFWDSKKIGIGPPPIKTKDGWLAIYQAVGYQDQGKYKVGAMLLDLNDPTKVLYRCSKPILEPAAVYENEGFKGGVVYPCGAVVVDGTLIVYYGGADMFVAAATADLNELLDQLKYNGTPHLDPINLEYLPEFNVTAN